MHDVAERERRLGSGSFLHLITFKIGQGVNSRMTPYANPSGTGFSSTSPITPCDFRPRPPLPDPHAMSTTLGTRWGKSFNKRSEFRVQGGKGTLHYGCWMNIRQVNPLDWKHKRKSNLCERAHRTVAFSRPGFVLNGREFYWFMQKSWSRAIMSECQRVKMWRDADKWLLPKEKNPQKHHVHHPYLIDPRQQSLTRSEPNACGKLVLGGIITRST